EDQRDHNHFIMYDTPRMHPLGKKIQNNEEKPKLVPYEISIKLQKGPKGTQMLNSEKLGTTTNFETRKDETNFVDKFLKLSVLIIVAIAVEEK
ncbi:hypothetical protein ACJX0J_007789, partial [Zea mays]